MDAVTFNPGDRVRKKSGRTFSSGDSVVTVTEPKYVDFVTGPAVWLEEIGIYMPPSDLEKVADAIEVRADIEAEAQRMDPAFLDPEVFKTDTTADDIVRRPRHYTQFAIEPITFIMRNGLPFWKGNIIKYACRAGSKLYDGMDAVESEITDLEKVRRYAEMRINQLRGDMEL